MTEDTDLETRIPSGIAVEISALVKKLLKNKSELRSQTWEGTAAWNEEDFDRLFELLEQVFPDAD